MQRPNYGVAKAQIHSLIFDDFRTNTGFSPQSSTTVCPCELVARALSLTHQESKLE